MTQICCPGSERVELAGWSPAEETSLKTWMELPSEPLHSASQELARNPFDRVLKLLEKLRV
jgi:hypothetical protein